jgi:hypothetical protein
MRKWFFAGLVGAGSPIMSVPVAFSIATGVTFTPRTTSVNYYYVRSGG